MRKESTVKEKKHNVPLDFFSIVPSPSKGILETVTLQSFSNSFVPSYLGDLVRLFDQKRPSGKGSLITKRAGIRGRSIPLTEAQHPPSPVP